MFATFLLVKYTLCSFKQFASGYTAIFQLRIKVILGAELLSEVARVVSSENPLDF